MNINNPVGVTFKNNLDNIEKQYGKFININNKKTNTYQLNKYICTQKALCIQNKINMAFNKLHKQSIFGLRKGIVPN